jgi:hypothetical protein
LQRWPRNGAAAKKWQRLQSPHQNPQRRKR